MKKLLIPVIAIGLILSSCNNEKVKKTLSEFDQFFTEFAEANYDLIIGVSFDAEKGIEKAAKEYPESNFVIIDSVVDLPNVKSIIFNQKEGSFLAGVLGQMVSKKIRLDL